MTLLVTALVRPVFAVVAFGFRPDARLRAGLESRRISQYRGGSSGPADRDAAGRRRPDRTEPQLLHAFLTAIHTETARSGWEFQEADQWSMSKGEPEHWGEWVPSTQKWRLPCCLGADRDGWRCP